MLSKERAKIPDAALLAPAVLFTDPNIAHDPEYDDRMMDLLRALRSPNGFSADVRELALRDRAAHAADVTTDRYISLREKEATTKAVDTLA